MLAEGVSGEEAALVGVVVAVPEQHQAGLGVPVVAPLPAPAHRVTPALRPARARVHQQGPVGVVVGRGAVLPASRVSLTADCL